MLTLLVALHGALGLLILACGGRWGRRALWVGGLAPAVTLLWLVTQLGTIGDGRAVIERRPWIPQLGLHLDLRLDGFATLGALLVAGIGVVVFAYAGAYLPGPSSAGGRDTARLVALLTWFAGSMLGLVLADNLIILFAFWELTTLTSYLLIGNDHERGAARRAALHALLVTGTGGLVLLGGFVVLANAAGTYRLSELLADPPASGPLVSTALVAVAVGAFTKSAVYPFHAWLPAAMVAPTPISAYLHSATMVKAGIVLLARFAPAFADHPPWRPLLITVGIVTLFGGGLRALRQHDLKLLLAYGTISQLGLLVVLFGIGEPATSAAACAMFLAHALFKAGLFLVVGIIDHQTGTRDVRRLSRVGRGWRGVQAAAVLSALSMAGMGVVFGFVSKELALDALVERDGVAAVGVSLAVVFGSVLTVAYSIRFAAGALGYLGEVTGEPAATGPPPSPPFVAPALLLAVIGVVLGAAPGLLNALLGAASASLRPPFAADNVASSAASAEPLKLALWHGVNTALLLSLAIAAGGALLHVGRKRFDRLASVGSRLPDGDTVYLALLRRLNVGADRVTAVVQSGSLPTYAAVILATASVLPLVALFRGDITLSRPASLASVAHLPIAVTLLAAALGAAAVRRRFAAGLFLGVVGYAMAGLFLVQGAPDLALTQVVFETLSTVLFMLVLRNLPDGFTNRSPGPIRALRVLVATGVGVMVFVFTLAAAQSRTATPVSAEMVERALPDGYGRNVVNVILVDFRAFDTLGEIAVLSVAAIGAVALARASRRAPSPPQPAAAWADRPDMVDLPVRLIFHALLIGSVFALFAGHNQPGGGFVGGLLAGAAIALRFVAGGMAEVRRVTPFKPWTILGAGLLLAVLTALAPMARGGPLLQSLERSVDGGVLGTIKPSTTLLFDFGVYLVVAGLVLMVFEAFGDEREVAT